MTTVTLTDFRSHASGMLTRVEHGETLVVLRHGRPIAEVSPVIKKDRSQPSWKRQALKVGNPSPLHHSHGGGKLPLDHPAAILMV